jgi:hypothetical protein
MPAVTVPLKLLRIKGSGIHLLLTARLNKQPVRLILDTGASQSVLDLNRITGFENYKKRGSKGPMATVGIGAAHFLKNILIKKADLSLGKILFPNLIFVGIDLSHINAAFEKLRIQPVDGILGGDFFYRHKAVIHYGQRKLQLTV